MYTHIVMDFIMSLNMLITSGLSILIINAWRYITLRLNVNEMKNSDCADVNATSTCTFRPQADRL